MARDRQMTREEHIKRYQEGLLQIARWKAWYATRPSKDSSVQAYYVLRRKPKPNPLNGIDRVFRNAARATLETCANEIDNLEKHKLEADGHVDSGELLGSIHHSTVRYAKGVVYVKGFADAKNNGVMYEEFIEHGSGKYRDDGTGRKTPWVYFVKNGEQKQKEVHSSNPLSGLGYRAEWRSDDYRAEQAQNYDPQMRWRARIQHPATYKGGATLRWNNRKKEVRVSNASPVVWDTGSFITTEGMEPDPFIKYALDIVNPRVSELFRQHVEAEMRTSGRYAKRMAGKQARRAAAKARAKKK